MPRVLFVLVIALLAAPTQSMAQGKGIRLWNLTTATISCWESMSARRLGTAAAGLPAKTTRSGGIP